MESLCCDENRELLVDIYFLHPAFLMFESIVNRAKILQKARKREKKC